MFKIVAEVSGAPSARHGHAMSAVASGPIVFGGAERGAAPRDLHDLWHFDLDARQWSPCATLGGEPIARVGASLEVAGDKAFLFGGFNEAAGWLDGLSILDLRTMTWTHDQQVVGLPSARDKLTSAVVGTTIFYFGGFGPLSNETGSDDDDDNLEDIAEEDGDEDGDDGDDGGDADHAASAKASKKQRPDAQFTWFNDLVALDTVSMTCTQVATQGPAPSPRAASGMVAVDGAFLYVFGGKSCDGRTNSLHKLNLATLVWESVPPAGPVPAPVSFHKLVVCGPLVLVTGGIDPENAAVAPGAFDTRTGHWLALPPDFLPAQRFFHNMTATEKHVVLFGGASMFDENTGEGRALYNTTFLLEKESFLATFIPPHADEAAQHEPPAKQAKH